MRRFRHHLPSPEGSNLLKEMDKQNHSSLLTGETPFGVKPIIDKTAFMNNICSCLDSCSAYIQALNSLCAAGTVLAHSLLQVFQELPPYRDLADQFVTMWEEMSKATAGASSGVKTETLMALQEVLNRLEEENSSMNVSQSSVHNTSVMENIKSVGSCLLSYVELQAQFSLSCWKSLSQISKNSESLIFFCLPRGFQDPSIGMDSSKNTSAVIRAPDELVVSIRKYFGQVLQKTIPISSSNQGPTALYSNFGDNNESPSSKSTTSRVSSSPQQMMFRGQQGLPPSNCWAHHPLHSSVSAPSSYGKINHKTLATSSPNEINPSKENAVSSELEEVLNLLSCQPNEPPSQTPNSNDKTAFLNNVLNKTPAENVNMSSGRLSLQSMPWCGADNAKELTTSSDSAIHNSFPYQQVVSYEGKRTWPRMGSSGGNGEDQSQFSFGGWVWGHPERGLSNNIPSSEQQSASTNIGALQSSQKRNLVNWCNGWNENSSSDEGSNSNNGQDNEVFYPLGGLGYADLVIQSDPPASTNRQRRHSSNDGLPDGCNNLTLTEPSTDKQLDSHAAPPPWQDVTKSAQTGKTSTWPLKQSVNSRLGLDGLLLGGGISAASPTPPPLLLAQIDRPKVLDRQDIIRESGAEPCLRVASLVEHWGGGMNSQSDKNKDGKKYTLFGQMS